MVAALTRMALMVQPTMLPAMEPSSTPSVTMPHPMPNTSVEESR